MKKDITQYKIFYSEDSEFVSDEVVKDEETLATNLDTDGWPREGRMHRWIKVNEAKKWCKEEKKQLWDVIDAYCDFSTRSGAFGRGEIYGNKILKEQTHNHNESHLKVYFQFDSSLLGSMHIGKKGNS